ncbi:MAG: hypothetical protein M3Z04_09280 [Chloroflexota bacterium]|nr:hypothetical protein [Chloroflexota bacterium]
MNQMMILRLLFVVVVLLGLAQLLDWVPAGTGSVFTWIHIIAGLALIVVMERIWSARTR